MTEDLKIERHGAVLVVTIHREHRMNALSQSVHDGLRETWMSLHGDPTVRAIVITGAGERAFCTGMDLQDFVERGGPRPAKENVKDEMRQTPLACDVWLPTVVAVNGVCTGAGFHFVADADIVIASTKSSFLDTHVSVGQVAALEPISLLPRIGLGNALRMTVLGRQGRIGPEEALRISLVDEIVEPDYLRSRAIALAEIAATGSPQAVMDSKKAIRAALERPMSEAMQYGWELLLAHRQHPDSHEGPIAFTEKRPPKWQWQ